MCWNGFFYLKINQMVRFFMARPITLALSILFIFPINSKAQEVLSLEKCREMARLNHPIGGKIPMIEMEYASRIKRLNRNYWPQSSLNGQASWQSDVTNVPISFPGIDIPSPPQDQYRLTLEVGQPVWDGGMTKALKKAHEYESQAKKEEVNAQSDLLEEQIGGLYFGVLLSQKQKENAELLKRELERNRSRLQAGVENGVVIRSDVRKLDARLLEVEQQLADVELQRSAYLEALSLLTGYSFSANTELEIPSYFFEEREVIDRAELRALNQRQLQLFAGESVVRAKSNPTIGLFATAGYGRPGLNLLSDEFDFFAIAGVQLRVPLSQLYSRTNRLEIGELTAQKMQLQKEKETIYRQFQVQQSQQKSEIERLQQLIENDRKIIAIREDLVRTAESQLENQVISSTDYLTEVNQKELAQQQLILHEIQLLHAIDQYRFIAGRR
jgi:outer membrane protein TolC